MPTPKQIARVRLLAEKWKEVKPETVDLNSWHIEQSCGTIACLAGHAALMPEFIKDGFHLDHDIGEPSFYGDEGIEACYEFFGVGMRLFGPKERNETNASDHAVAAERMRMWLEIYDK